MKFWEMFKLVVEDFLMRRLILIHLCVFFIFRPVEAQFNEVEDGSSSQDGSSNFQPSLAVVIGILCIMFFITFILLVYAKFCHRGATVHGDSQNPSALIRLGSSLRYSGIDKTVIESLPFFKFSSLKGTKKGLECAVCLSKFEDIEVLRLLPKCKHAFHINCVDQWLEKHSSCPLCRCKVSAEDTTVFTYSNSMRFLWNQSELREDSNIELFVQREGSRHGSSRFSIGSRTEKVPDMDEEEALIRDDDDEEEEEEEEEMLHKFNHRIIISDVVLKNRWSNVSSSDLMFLNAEMLQDISSNRFSSLDSDKKNEQMINIREETEKKISNYYSATEAFPGISNTPRIVNSGDRRSVSEITGLSRFRNLSIKSTVRESFSGENTKKEDKLRRVWLPIATRTVQWFANRETTSHQTDHVNTGQTLHV